MYKNIEELNIVSPIKEITIEQNSVSKNTYEENDFVEIVKEKILVEKDEQELEGEVILSFTAGENSDKFIAYTLENLEEENEKPLVEIGKVTIDENGMYITAPSREEHEKIVVPAIVAIGNSNLSDPEEIENNVRESINDDNFNITSLNSISEDVEQYKRLHEKNKKSIFKVKSSIPVIIQVAKLRAIKKVYQLKVNMMFNKSLNDIDKRLDAETLISKIDENDKAYRKISELSEQFKELSEDGKYDKDIQELENMNDVLDIAKRVYTDKLNDIQSEDYIINAIDQNEMSNTEYENVPENLIEEPVEKYEETKENIVEEYDEVGIEEILEENEKLVENNEGNMEKNYESNSEVNIETEEDLLKAKTEQMIGEFNKEIKSFKDELVEQYIEKYNREQEIVIKNIRNMYEGYITELRDTLTSTLDKVMLETSSSIRELKNANEDLKRNLALTEKKLEEEKLENSKLRDTINSKDKAISDLRQDSEKMEEDNKEKDRTIESLKTENAEKDIKIKNLEADKEANIEENEQLKSENKSKSTQIRELTEKLEIEVEKSTNYKNQLDVISNNMDELRRETEEYKRRSSEELTRLESKISKYSKFFSDMQAFQAQMSEKTYSKEAYTEETEDVQLRKTK